MKRVSRIASGQDALIFTEGPRSPVGRLSLLLPGGGIVVAAVAAISWLARAQPEPAWGALFGIAWLALAGIVGLMILRQGLVPAQHLRIDPVAGRVTLSRHRPFKPVSRTEVALAALPRPRVYTRPAAHDFPEQPVLEIALSNTEWIDIESFPTLEEALACAAEIAALIERAAAKP